MAITFLFPAYARAADPPTEQNISWCDTTCQTTAPITITQGVMDVNFDYTAPVEIIAGVLSQDFSSAWWLTGSCTMSSDYTQAGSNISLLSCPNVPLPALSEQGWVFWLVAPAATADLADEQWWSMGIYELRWYQVAGAPVDGDGPPASEVINSLLQDLKADPEVAVAAADEDGHAVWALHQSGVEYVYEVFDEDPWTGQPQESGNTSETKAAFQADSLDAGKTSAPAGNSARFVAQTSYFVMPETNKAGLANSCYKLRPQMDTRSILESILKRCGYKVDIVDADLEFFKNLSKYSVIYIAAHGRPRKVDEEVYDEVSEMIYNTIGPNRPFCGLKGNEAVLDTGVNATQTLKEQYKEDLECGRLKIGRRYDRSKKTFGKEYFVVTPNYVRQHDKGTFPSNVLMCLNSCKGFYKDGSSPWADLMLEKSNGSVVIGWDDTVSYYTTAARAMLQLFQLMAGTNDELDIAVLRPNQVTDYYELLRKTPVPAVPQPLGLALAALSAKNFDKDPRGAQLARMKDRSDLSFILAPAIYDLTIEATNDAELIATIASDTNDEAELRFADGKYVTLEPSDPEHFEYECKIPAGYYGPMSIHQSDRFSPPRYLHRWYPIEVTETSNISNNESDGLYWTYSYDLNDVYAYRLSARAICKGFRLGPEVWAAPDPAADTFYTNIDRDGSTISFDRLEHELNKQCMSIGGIYPYYTCFQWSRSDTKCIGSGLYNMLTCDATWSFTNDSETIPLTLGQACFENYLVCMGIDPIVACTCTGDQCYDNTWTNHISLVRSHGFTISIGADWSILPGKYTCQGCVYDTLDLSNHDSVIEWKGCTPDPPFDSSLEPR